MFQHHQFGRPQFAQGATLINPVPMTFTFAPAQQYNILSTPIAVIHPISNDVLYTDTQMNSALRFVLLHDDYLPMIETYTVSKVTTIKELATAREKFLAGYQPEQANILRRVVEGQLNLEEVKKHKIHDYEGAVKTLEKLNNSIREAVNNVELVGVTKSIGYEGSEQVLQVSVQIKNKIDGVVTTVRTIGGSYAVPAFSSGYPAPRSYNPTAFTGQHSTVDQPNRSQGFTQTNLATHYFYSLQRAYATEAVALPHPDLHKPWVIQRVFNIPTPLDVTGQQLEEFVDDVRELVCGILDGTIADLLETGSDDLRKVFNKLIQTSEVFKSSPFHLLRESTPMVIITQGFLKDPTHRQWLKETIGFDLQTPNAMQSLLHAVTQLLK